VSGNSTICTRMVAGLIFARCVSWRRQLIFSDQRVPSNTHRGEQMPTCSLPSKGSSSAPLSCVFIAQVGAATAFALILAAVGFGDVRYSILQQKLRPSLGTAAESYARIARPRSTEGLPACARNNETAKSFLLVFMGHCASIQSIFLLPGNIPFSVADLYPERRSIRHF
jgi:hypothetical protein